MSSAPVLVVAHPREVALWQDALRARGLDVVQADRKGARGEAGRRAPAVVVVSEKLPFAGALRVIRDLRRDPVTSETPVVMVGVRPFTTAQRIRLGASAPDGTVPPGASPEALAEEVAETLRRGKVPQPELTPAQQAGLRYTRIANMLMFLGVIFASTPASKPGESKRGWFLLLVPLGGLIADVATGRVDGRKRPLSWQGWAAIGLSIVIALGIVLFPNFFLFR
jgi:hypothetical protein